MLGYNPWNMKKLQQEAQILLGYEHGDRDTEILHAVLKHGTLGEVAKRTHFKKRTVQRRLAAMRKSAQRFGYSPHNPQTSHVHDMPIFAKSTLIKHPEVGPGGGVVMEWQKVRAEDTCLIEAVKAAVQGMHTDPLPPVKATQVAATREILPILTIADAHLGLLAYRGETGEDWSLTDSMELLKRAITTLVDKMEVVKEAVLIDAGDMTHTDGVKPVTPKSGNQLDASHSYFEISRAASELMRFTITQMLKKAEHITVMSVRGNHNDETAWHVNEQLIALYELEPRVTVQPNDAYTLYHTWGKNFIVATHGDAAKNMQMYQYITTKWPELFGQSKYTYVVKGHVHHARQEAIGNMMFETHSTLTKSDAYHEFKQYKSLRQMSLVNLHKDGGEDSRHTYIPRY